MPSAKTKKSRSRPPEPRRRKAAVRQHSRGHFLIRDKGKDVYLGTEFFAAQAKAVELLGEDRVKILKAPNTTARQRLRNILRESTLRACEGERRDPQVVRMLAITWQHVHDELLEQIKAECDKEGVRHFQKTARPFLDAFGDHDCSSLLPQHLSKFRVQILTHYSAKSVNHRLATTRRLLRFAFDMSYVQTPYQMGMLRSVKLPPSPDKSLSAEEIRKLIAAVAQHNDNLARMLLLQFWTCMRPSEVPKVVYRRGTFEPRYPGVFRLKNGKTDKQTGEPTRIVLPDEAISLLETIKPNYCNARNFDKGCRIVARKMECDWSPGPLRHSAATILIDNGVDGEIVETCLHHTPGRIRRTYQPPPYAKAREALKILSELVPVTVVTGGQKSE
jgi:integrase